MSASVVRLSMGQGLLQEYPIIESRVGETGELRNFKVK